MHTRTIVAVAAAGLLLALQPGSLVLAQSGAGTSGGAGSTGSGSSGGSQKAQEMQHQERMEQQQGNKPGRPDRNDQSHSQPTVPHGGGSGPAKGNQRGQ